ncbi:hypothetical protein NQ317_007090 [Molorchus minor]|uniref:Odorant receptor n=1 Tax=Molorchus minor TaxID=1323400 RepID=A0ABQ9K4F7_9CUCU|nr:hypothetical protein NQ317_007090 [Molorchus minor]
MKEDKETYNFLDSFKTEKLFLTVAGFYPCKNLKYIRILVISSAIFNLSIAWLQFLALLTFMFFSLPDISKVSEILLFCTTQFAFLIKLTNFILNKNSLLQLEVTLQNKLFTLVTADEKPILTRYLRDGKFIAKVYRLLCFLVVVFYAIFPFMDSQSENKHKLPLPAWFPFNPDDHYYLVFCGEILSIALGAWINSNIDILTIMMIILATALFEVLKQRLRNILKPADKVEIVQDGLVNERLKVCVFQYDYLLRFVSQIEATFSKGIFIQFFCSVVVICLTGFQMLVISFKSMQFVLLIIYFSCMMCQIAMYCWYGQMIAESSDEITQACYFVEWNVCNVNVQKTLIVIMERAKRPAVLRAGGFFVLSIPTLMTASNIQSYK